jgi:ELWxxDGT repeat protein
MQRTTLMFWGIDAAGNNGLWESNGTAAGTYELTGISGAASDGLGPNDITAFGEALFSGHDGSGDWGLWVTNGTAAGTHELTVIPSAFMSSELFPSSMTVFNGEVLFGGDNHATIIFYG